MIPPEIEAIALLGWHVYPCSTVSRAGCFEKATDAATCDLDTIKEWTRRFPGCNWRLVFGPSRLWGCDCDSPPLHADDGVKAIADLQTVHGPLPPGPRSRSGGGGLGFYFQHNGEPIRGDAGYPAKGIDPRRGRQSQTIPPSRHIVTGKYYEWLRPPWEVATPAAPAWLLRRVAPEPPQTIRAVPPMDDVERRSYAVSALRRAVQRVAATGEGNRNNALNREAWSLARFIKEGALTDSEIRESMYAAAKVCGLEARAALTTINGAIRSAAR